MPSEEPTHLCLYEGRRFPASEFEQSSAHGLVHNRDPLHTALGGEIEPAGKHPHIPGPAKAPRESAASNAQRT
jgi:hypothetical protein